jgi:hypothetical protein
MASWPIAERQVTGGRKVEADFRSRLGRGSFRSFCAVAPQSSSLSGALSGLTPRQSARNVGAFLQNCQSVETQSTNSRCQKVTRSQILYFHFSSFLIVLCIANGLSLRGATPGQRSHPSTRNHD